MSKKKKILKFSLYGFGVIALIITGLVIWYWESVVILFGNKNLEGKIDEVPQRQVKVLPEITNGESDWPNWLGANGDNSSSMTTIPKDWSSLKKVWPQSS